MAVRACFAVRRCRVAGERLVVEPEQQRGQGNQSHRVRPVIRGENIADRADVAVEKTRRSEDFGRKWRRSQGKSRSPSKAAVSAVSVPST
jgi:hypothetical protein